MAIETLTSADLVLAVRAYGSALAVHRGALNRLNVYPVPDGDTGTNMALTVEAVLAELSGRAAGDGAAGDGKTGAEAAREGEAGGEGTGEADVESPEAETGALTMKEVAEALSHGSLMGARGNSGVILSQVLRGLAAVVRQHESLRPADLVEGFGRAAETSYAAVSNPVEGTILTVARAAAEGAAEASGRRPGASPSLLEVLDAARGAAARALAGTTEQLPALAAAGVVDAGGAGLLLLFDALLQVVDGREVPAPPAPSRQARQRGGGVTGPGTGGAGWVAGEGTQGGPGEAPTSGDSRAEGVGEFRYEVMFFLEAPDEAMTAFREVWEDCGGSVVIVGGDGLYNCHIHTGDIGAAIEAAIEIGRPRQVRVSDLAEQVDEERWVREAAASAEHYEPPPEPVATAVVAVCAGEGVKRIFRSLGVHQFVAGGQTANPSVAELLDAVGRANAEQVVVLPNNANVVPAAEQAAANVGKKVRVVPTGGIAEGFAALLDYDPEADVDTNADTMAAAAARVLPGEVARASKDAESVAGPVRRGDWLGLSRGEVRVVVPPPAGAADAAIALLAALVPGEEGYEMVTVIEGEGATAAATRRVVEWVSEDRPGLSVEVHHGGQPLYPYVLSVE